MLSIVKEAKKVFDIEIESLLKVKNSLNGDFEELVDLIRNSHGRVIMTGMGKAGHIAKKVSATMSSLGTACYFLHPAEGLHGDLGTIKEDDIVIAFSKSGESDEVIGLIPSIKKIGAKLVSVTCKDFSTLSESADLKIKLPIIEEASAHKLAPTTSTTAMIVFGDALAVVLEKLNGFKPEDFAVFHPNGALGKKLLLNVESLMIKDDDIPVVNEKANIKETIMIMSCKGLGAVSVIDENYNLIGLVTDGDLRRAIENYASADVFTVSVKDIMTSNPICINKNQKAIDALSLMENRAKQISILPVTNDDNRLVGMLRIHDIIRAGIV